MKEMNPIPPPTLNKETVGVWHGWSNIGDKEVAREAAAKGLHTNLAVAFLAARKKIKLEDAEIWFKEEVLKWVHELLERKQIFKASHVLNNINVDSKKEFSKIFYASVDGDLREYIGKHLQKGDGLERNLQELWCFLNLILENENLIPECNLPLKSIECLDKQNDNYKSEIATILFLRTDDSRLKRFLNAKTLWRHLLINNDLNHLLIWIGTKYKSDVEDVVEENLLDQFKKFSITEEMLNFISSAELGVSVEIRNALFNELSKLGIFQPEEKNDFILLLKRWKDSCSLANLYQILIKNSSVVTRDNFIKLLIEYCLSKQHFTVLSASIKHLQIPTTNSELMNLFEDFCKLVNDFNEILLSNNIFKLCCTLSSDVVTYFKDNPTVFLSFLFFAVKDVADVMIKSILIINDIILNDCMPSMLEQFSVLNSIYYNKIRGVPRYNLNIYNLIGKHLKIDKEHLFKFRFIDNKLVHFNTHKVVQDYSYYKKINYKFYVKQTRPSIASKMFVLNELDMYSSLKEKHQEVVEKKICRLAITNFECDKTCASCISFSKMLGLNSTKLRVLLRAARTLYNSGYDQKYLLELFFNNDDDTYTVQNLLEKILIETVESDSFLNGAHVIKAVKMFEVVVQCSELNNIKLPELFLKYFASRNLWLPFLILAQIHDYPIDQIKLLTQFFKSPNMLEHLTHGVVHHIEIEEKNVLIRERDSRKYLLSKVGVRKNVEIVAQHSSHSLKSQSSFESGESSSSSDLFEIDVSNIKATLLQTLIRCHNSTDPPKALLQASQLYRNPLLAIFATSYEPDSVITNWLTWLTVSCEMCKMFTNYEAAAVSANSVTNLLEKCLRSGHPKTVLESFEIFIPENPLKIFMEFLYNYYKLNFNSSLLLAKLETFQVSLKSSRKNSTISETDREMTYLNNKLWIETTAVRLLLAVIGCSCTSSYEQISIVESLCNIKIWEYLSCDCPDFDNVLSILKALYYSNSNVTLDISVIFDMKNSRQAVVSCINELLDGQQYRVALKIAQIEKLPPDLILVKKWQSKMNDRSDQHFWQICNESFTKHNVTADCVVDFYVNCSETFSDFLEKFTLLKLAWEWAQKYDLSCQYELEKKMWIAFLRLEEKNRDLDIFDIQSTSYLYKDLINTLGNIVPVEDELNKDFASQIDRIVSFALNRGNFWLALKLQKMFNCKNTDLETLKLCHSLAEGILLPYQLNAEQRLLLSNVNYLRTYSSHKKTYLSTRISTVSSSSHSPANSLHIQTTDCIDSYMNDTLAILKLLSEHLHNGLEIGQNIFMNYRISINIDIPYQVVVVATDYMKLLRDALGHNCLNKLDVVHDFIWAYKWSKHDVADFICEELVNATSRYVDSQQDRLTMWDLSLDQDFVQVLQLLQDNCSILGYKIYSYASTLYKSHIESESLFKTSNLALVTELLIRAHECFTADCNMEGISMILKKSKEIVANFLVLQDWKLIVRLLTGIGRYTEMNYVFQILKENDQFEFLLRKGLRKDGALKVALLEYLNKFCPDNRDLYKIVALHFTLFSEVAMLWEKEAQNVIKNLVTISKLEMQNNKMNPEEEPFILFQNTDSTKKFLRKALENYIHATDFHLQGEKLNKAINSTRQAELVALQLGIISEVPTNGLVICLLNLRSSQIVSLISSKLNFEQSLILVETYNFHTDWASVLYEQYVIKNNSIFLEGFLKHLPLTETLIYDMSRKFITTSVNSMSSIECMKNVLNRLSSLHMKYRIASELGFTDLVEDLIATGQLVYLKDTVWKKGYKS